MYLVKLSGDEQPYESKKNSFMYKNQYVPFERCKLTIPTSLEKIPPLRYI